MAGTDTPAFPAGVSHRRRKRNGFSGDSHANEWKIGDIEAGHKLPVE
jgi:hypothetical protein